jgi:tRNA(fMet)-specific endonuclease VapC
MIILDTDAVTFLERGASGVSKRLRERLTALSAEHEIVTTVVTYEEQTRGWFTIFARAGDSAEVVAAYESLLGHLRNFKEIDVVAYSASAEEKFQELRRQRIRIGTRDLRIAAIALSRDATLLTRNLGDFGKVPGLRVEDWMRE